MSIIWSVLRSEEIKAQNHADVNLPAANIINTGSSIDVTNV